MRILITLVVPMLAGAAVWPEEFAGWRRVAVEVAPVTDRALWDEFGLKESEAALFESGGLKLRATAWRLQDATGALAAFQWQRPPGAKPWKLAELAAETPQGVLFVEGNCLLSFPDHKLSTEEVTALVAGLRNVERAPLPSLVGALPQAGLVPASERYILGPVSLERFDSRIPPAAAAFSVGAEAQAGVYRVTSGEVKMAIFNYPTPQIAMQRVAEFERIAGAMVKRAGPLVAVIPGISDRDSGERLLSQVKYSAQITLDERVPTQKDNPANLVYNAFVLAGILLSFCAFSGLAVGGLRVLQRRLLKGEEPEPMIRLHLDDRRRGPVEGR